MTRASKRLLKLYAEDTPIAAELARRAGATCREGCAHCCYQLALMTPAEGMLIAKAILAPEFTAWEETLLKCAKAARDFCDGEPVKDGFITRSAVWEARQACAFLGPDNRCAVYTVRPGVCRYQYVVSDPANCAYDAADPLVKQLDTGRFTLRLLAMAFQDARFSPGVLAPIPLVVLWCAFWQAHATKDIREDLIDGLMEFPLLDPSGWAAKFLPRLTEEVVGSMPAAVPLTPPRRTT